MPRDLDQVVGSRVERGGVASPKVKGGLRSRLFAHAWRGLAAAAVFVSLCVVFGEEEPAPAVESKNSLSGDFGLVAALNFAADGQTLLSTSWDKTVRIWDVGAMPAGFGEELARLPALEDVYDVTMSPDGQTVVVASTAGVAFWNWRDAGAVPEIVDEPGRSRALAFSPDGRSLLVGGFDGRVRLMDLESRRVSTTLGEPGDVVRGLWVTPDESLLIALSYNGELRFWDWASKRQVDGIEGSKKTVLAVAVSPDGETLALSRYWREPGEIELWDLETGELKARCRGHDGVTHALAYSRDGGTLASAGSDLRIRFWNAETGRSAGGIENTGGWVRVLEFSVDGRWLAYSGAWNRVQLKRIELPGLAVRTKSDAEVGGSAHEA